MDKLATIIETIGQILLRLAESIRAGTAEYARQRGQVKRSKIILP